VSTRRAIEPYQRKELFQCLSARRFVEYLCAS
jgi:hypothetical protein